jgi:predicted RecA/RadA family phage recombinase
MAKLRFLEHLGLYNKESAHQMPGTIWIDYPNQAFAVATPAVDSVLFAYPNAQPIHLQLGATEPLGSALGVATADKAAGALSVAQFGNIVSTGVFANPFLISRSDANAVVTYANLTVQLVLVSTSNTSTTAVSNALGAALALSGLTNIATAIPMGTVPAIRQVLNPATGLAIANAVQLFPGDLVIARFVNATAISTVAAGNILAITAEVL